MAKQYLQQLASMTDDVQAGSDEDEPGDDDDDDRVTKILQDEAVSISIQVGHKL